MKFYYLNTKFTFGKFKDKKLEEVVLIEPDYISWCSLNLDNFLISNKVISNLKELNPNFYLPNTAINKLQEKKEIESQRLKKYYKENDDDCSDNDDYNQNVFNNPFYNDNNDMDQQSDEFWNCY